MWKFSSQHPKAERDIFKLLVLSNLRSKTKRILIYMLYMTKKSSNPNVLEAGTSKFF